MDVNVLLIIVLAAMLFKIVDGYKKGMIKEIISLVSLAVLCTVVALIAGGISSYQDGKFFNVAAAFILLLVLGIVHHLLSLVFFSAKMVSKLPVIHFADKLLGVVFGVLEVVVLLWTVYTFVMMKDMGSIEEMILACTDESRILTWFYSHNYLAYGMEYLLSEFSFISISEWLENVKN